MKTIEQRFWDKVDRRSNKECWNWKASIFTNGYGQFRKGKHKIVAHKFSWELHRNLIPDGLCVLHTCDNRKCVNPNHLFLGTHQDNMDDKVKKNRQSRLNGIDNGKSKLTEQQIIEIRKKHKILTYKQIAIKYDISLKQVYNILKYKQWKHL